MVRLKGGLNLKKLKNKAYDSGKATTMILLLIIVILLIIGLKVGKAYFDNATLKSQVEEMSERALLESGYNLTDNLIKVADTYDIKLKPEEIKYSINAKNDQINVKFSYVKRVDFYIAQVPIPLSIDVTKEMAKARSIIDNFKNDLEGGSRGSSQRYMEDVKNKLKE